jgi:hypothetical protein
MALDETKLEPALMELTHKWIVTWYLLTAILKVIGQDSPILIERIKAVLESTRAQTSDPDLIRDFDQAISTLGDFPK